jgi:hypothetical protein
VAARPRESFSEFSENVRVAGSEAFRYRALLARCAALTRRVAISPMSLPATPSPRSAPLRSRLARRYRNFLKPAVQGGAMGPVRGYRWRATDLGRFAAQNTEPATPFAP